MINSKANSISIKLENADKVYDNGIKAVDHLNLTVNPGEFCVLLGPSGCGKTTVLRMIAGLESISDGHLKFNDVIMNSTAPKDRNISMVFQNYALYPFMTVYNNVAFGIRNKARNNPQYNELKAQLKTARSSNYKQIKDLQSSIEILKRGSTSDRDKLLALRRDLKGFKVLKDVESQRKINGEIDIIKNRIKSLKSDPSNLSRIQELKNQISALKTATKKDDQGIKDIKAKQREIVRKWRGSIPEKIEEISQLLGINMYLRRKPAELSGGQRQRVALARAVSKETSIFLYDEPLSNLDAKLRAKMRVEIRDLHDKLGATSIYVTHDQIEAMSMADKIVVMNRGYVQQVGTPLELIDKPYNLFVARFIGNTDVNIMEADYVSETQFKVGKQKVSLTNRDLLHKLDWSKNRKVFLMFRPEHAIVDPTLVDNAQENVFTGEITKMEMLGSTVLIELKVENFGKVSITVPTTQSLGLKVGSEFKFAINPNKIQVYDDEYGYNISESFSEENIKAREVWVTGLNERYKNDILMQYQKNKIKLSEWPLIFIKSLFMESEKERIRKALAKPTAAKEKIAR